MAEASTPIRARRRSNIAEFVLAAAMGLAIGVGGYTFLYAKGSSYLTDNPAACANCHIMREHYDGWVKSSHRAVAVCNDCHTPEGFMPKYITKASNGFWHSFAFTTGRFGEHYGASTGGEAPLLPGRRAHRRDHRSDRLG
ncbi:MAG: NapC/NirT family cytochrome c [Candidatus Entotheonellia bacterium]